MSLSSPLLAMSRLPGVRRAAALACVAGALAGSALAADPASPAPSGPDAQGFAAVSASAAKAREEGRREEAVELYRRALKLRASWLEGRWALATLLYDLDRFREAAGEFEEIVAARPADGQAMALLGISRARLGEHDLALATLMQARGLDIPSPEVRSVTTFQTAVLLNRLGDPDSAFETLRPFAIEGDDRPFVIEAFGLITLRLPLLPGEVPEDKREMVVLAGRGGYHMARVRRDEIGRMALEELISRYPAARNVHYALGMYLIIDEPDTAIEEFRREIAAFPDHHVAMIQLALAELRRGRAEAALPVAAEAARLAPNVPAARLVHGRALQGVGRVGEAVTELEAAVALAPENARLRFSLARAYTEAGRSADAAREREEFQRLQKQSRTSTSAPGDVAGEPSPDGR